MFFPLLKFYYYFMYFTNSIFKIYFLLVGLIVLVDVFYYLNSSVWTFLPIFYITSAAIRTFKASYTLLLIFCSSFAFIIYTFIKKKLHSWFNYWIIISLSDYLILVYMLYFLVGRLYFWLFHLVFLNLVLISMKFTFLIT